MEQINLTEDQIIDLIFEKKIIYENISISAKHSSLGIIFKIEERLRNGKIPRRKNSVFCQSSESGDYGDRIELATASDDTYRRR